MKRNTLNFSISELIYSQIAIKNNINNMPDINSLDNLLLLIYHCLQPLRNVLNEPIIITSGYRCKKVNKICKGKANSQHLEGKAVDFIVKSKKPNEIIKIIEKNNIPFDQLINEKNEWVHISYNKNKNRKQILNI